MVVETGPWKVGELAKATGLTVRTLHHYDEIGLLHPSQHTDCGHRLYTKHDLARLQQILGLRQLGFSLDQVKAALHGPDFSPLETIASLRQDLSQRRIEIDTLDERLAEVERIMSSGGEVSAGRLIELIEGMMMIEKYFTKDQLEKIREQTAALGPEYLRLHVEKDWPELVAAVKVEKARGTDPSDPKVQALAARWTALSNQYTGDDPAIAAGMRKMFECDAEAVAKAKVTDPRAVADLTRCIQYIQRAWNARQDSDK